MIGKENYNFKRTKPAVKIRIWRVNNFDKLQVIAQAGNNKKLLPGVLEKSRNSARNESLNVDLNYAVEQLNTERRYKRPPSSTLLLFFFKQLMSDHRCNGHETEALRELLFVGFVSAHLCIVFFFCC